MPELKEMIEAVEKSVHDFKHQYDEALEAKADRALLSEVSERFNADIDAKFGEYKGRIDEIERKANLAGLMGDGDMDPREEAREAQQFARMVTGKPEAEGDIDTLRRYKSALTAYLRKGPQMSSDLRAALEVGVDPSGGYYVTPNMQGRIVRLVRETSPMRRRAAQQTIGTDALEGFNDLNQAGAGWVAETGARTVTSTPDTGKWRIPVHEMYANPQTTQQLLDDADIDIEEWLTEKVARRFMRLENTAFVTGSGVGQPRGFTTYSSGTPSASTWNVIEQTNSGASGAFKAAGSSPADPFITMIGNMKAEYRDGLSWAMNRSTWAETRKLKDSNGNYLFGTTLADGILNFQLMGFPVDSFEDMADIAADSLSIALANWGQAYQIVDRQGIRLLRDPYTSKPNVLLYTTARVGGDVINFEAIKLMKFAA